MSNNLWPSLIFHIWSALEEFLLFCLIPSLQRITPMYWMKANDKGLANGYRNHSSWGSLWFQLSCQPSIKSSQKGWLISFYWCISDSSFYCCSIREEKSLVPSLLWRVCQFLTFNSFRLSCILDSDVFCKAIILLLIRLSLNVRSDNDNL